MRTFGGYSILTVIAFKIANNRHTSRFIYLTEIDLRITTETATIVRTSVAIKRAFMTL